VDYPRAGAHYTRSTGEFLAWFRTDEDCLDYLEWLRWPGGFACPHCGHAGGWRLAGGRVECGGCSRRTSVTAGTIFDKTRTPLTVWFHACWLFATAKDGVSAQQLQRVLEIGSYHTAWAMLHRLRSALVRPGRDRLAGTAEVDETFIGGEEHGLRGGRQPGKKVLAGIAVEISEPKGIGRCRMAVLADASAASLRPFVAGSVEPGSRVITDGWVGYNRLASWGYDHERRNQEAAARRGQDPVSCCPPCTGSPRCASGGCWAPTRAAWTRRTCRPTWTSSPSGSTAATHAAAAWCSTACWTSPPGTTRCATTTSSPPASHATCRRSGGAPATRPAWTAPPRPGPGEPLKCSFSSHSA
jgi:hypothetical protein